MSIDKAYLENVLDKYANFHRHPINDDCELILNRLVERAKQGHRFLIILQDEYDYINHDCLTYVSVDYVNQFFQKRNITFEPKVRVLGSF